MKKYEYYGFHSQPGELHGCHASSLQWNILILHSSNVSGREIYLVIHLCCILSRAVLCTHNGGKIQKVKCETRPQMLLSEGGSSAGRGAGLTGVDLKSEMRSNQTAGMLRGRGAISSWAQSRKTSQVTVKVPESVSLFAQLVFPNTVWWYFNEHF